MTITKPKLPGVPKGADAFIAGAPDAPKSTGRGLKRGKKEQIAVIVAPDLLDRLDAMAADMGQSRSALISLAIFQALKTGFQVRGGDQG